MQVCLEHLYKHINMKLGRDIIAATLQPFNMHTIHPSICSPILPSMHALFIKHLLQNRLNNEQINAPAMVVPHNSVETMTKANIAQWGKRWEEGNEWRLQREHMGVCHVWGKPDSLGEVRKTVPDREKGGWPGASQALHGKVEEKAKAQGRSRPIWTTESCSGFSSGHWSVLFS